MLRLHHLHHVRVLTLLLTQMISVLPRLIVIVYRILLLILVQILLLVLLIVRLLIGLNAFLFLLLEASVVIDLLIVNQVQVVLIIGLLLFPLFQLFPFLLLLFLLPLTFPGLLLLIRVNWPMPIQVRFREFFIIINEITQNFLFPFFFLLMMSFVFFLAVFFLKFALLLGHLIIIVNINMCNLNEWWRTASASPTRYIFSYFYLFFNILINYSWPQSLFIVLTCFIIIYFNHPDKNQNDLS